MQRRATTMSLIVALVLVLLGANAWAAPLQRPRIGEVFTVTIQVDSKADLDELIGGGFDVDNVQGSAVTLYVTAEELNALRLAGYEPQPVDTGSTGERESGKALGAYHDYAGVTAALESYAANYPGICRLWSVGQSVQGRELWAVLITGNPDTEEDEPEFKYVSTMHGDEPVGTELCLYFIDMLLAGYGQSQRITDLVDETAIWVLPLMNPDGLEAGRRYNAGGYDLNRTFPTYPNDYTGTVFDMGMPSTQGYPAEVAALMTWTASNRFVLSANLHTGALLVNYPYDENGVPSGTDAPAPDDALFEHISRAYSRWNPPMWSSPLFNDGISNGCAWYRVFGSMQDWNYRYAGCNEVTIESSNVKIPPASKLPELWSNNRESMLSYLETVHLGVRGVVTSVADGGPLSAKVTVHGNAQAVFTDPDVGDYHRMLLPGTHTLTFSSPGHYPLTVTGVEVGPDATTRVDVALVPLEYSADVNNDSFVNALDVQSVINGALGQETGWDCDINADGAVDAVDVQLVLNACSHT